MCGRYTVTTGEGIAEEFGLAVAAPLAPRYNIAPTQEAPVIANRRRRAVEFMRWGLVPYWAKDPRMGSRFINARLETAAGKPAFRDALVHRRCLVVADGFYEWKRLGAVRTPYYLRRRSPGVFAFAGLWERWKTPDATWLLSFTILSAPANRVVAPIHDRMPVVVMREDYDRWLTPEPVPAEALADILISPPDDLFTAYRVSPLVNSPAHDEPACIAPAADEDLVS